MNGKNNDRVRPASDVAFTATVKATQERLGSRKSYERMEQGGGWSRVVSAELADFISERDSFYLGSVSSEGRPYIQHRGGKPGFLKVLDEKTLGYADFSGNRQYISMGNFRDNDRAFIFLMDYANRRRVKLWGRAEFVEGNAELERQLHDEDYKGRVERAMLFHIEAWDINCPQHIAPRFTEREIEPMIDELRRKNEALQAQVADLEAQLTAAGKQPLSDPVGVTPGA